MRYKIEDGNLVKVKKIEFDGVVVTNPSDELIDEKGLGYVYVETECPEYDSSEYNHVHTYVLNDGVITDEWTLTPVTNNEKIDLFQNMIDSINSQFEVWKNTGIEYNGAKYLPRWINEYYNSMMILGSSIFPMYVSDITGASKEFTYEQFVALYSFLIQTATIHTAEVNAQITELNETIAELENV